MVEVGCLVVTIGSSGWLIEITAPIAAGTEVVGKTADVTAIALDFVIDDVEGLKKDVVNLIVPLGLNKVPLVKAVEKLIPGATEKAQASRELLTKKINESIGGQIENVILPIHNPESVNEKSEDEK